MSETKDRAGRERNCDICGKIFINNPDWVYKMGSGSGEKVFCSWKCLRVYEKRKLSKVDQREAIINMLIEGKSITEIAEGISCDSRSVYYWKKKLEKDGVI